MITPIKAMTISQIVTRQDDLLASVDDVKELAKNEREDAINKYKNQLWKDIETRYKNDLEILGHLSAENLLKDVHNAICYFAEQLKEQEGELK